MLSLYRSIVGLTPSYLCAQLSGEGIACVREPVCIFPLFNLSVDPCRFCDIRDVGSFDLPPVLIFARIFPKYDTSATCETACKLDALLFFFGIYLFIFKAPVSQTIESKILC